MYHRRMTPSPKSSLTQQQATGYLRSNFRTFGATGSAARFVPTQPSKQASGYSSLLSIILVVPMLFFLTLQLALAVEPADKQLIKIGLLDQVSTLFLTANHDYQISETGRVLLEIPANKTILLRSSPAAANSLLIAAAPALVTTSKNIKIECLNQPCLFQIKTSREDKNSYDTFRGSLIIIPFKTYFRVINEIELEDYLRGVVPSEMIVSWPLEALKAQAVAARTYTMAMLSRRKTLGYDLKATVEDQMYLGYKKENTRTNLAIKTTQGELLLDKQNLLVDAYFSSHAGNFSSSPENTWGLSPKPYLVQVKEAYGLEANSQRNWERKFSQADLQNKLKDLKLNQIEAITITKRSLEGRVTGLLVSGIFKLQSLTHIYLTGEEFRHHLSLPSTHFNLQVVNGTLTLSGIGYGHGIGMSQYGAKYLAEHKASYQEILGHYYHGSKLLKL